MFIFFAHRVEVMRERTQDAWLSADSADQLSTASIARFFSDICPEGLSSTSSSNIYEKFDQHILRSMTPSEPAIKTTLQKQVEQWQWEDYTIHLDTRVSAWYNASALVST